MMIKEDCSHKSIKSTKQQNNNTTIYFFLKVDLFYIFSFQ